MIGILAFGSGFTSKFVSTRHTECSRLADMSNMSMSFAGFHNELEMSWMSCCAE
jgi:hypothetical protein